MAKAKRNPAKKEIVVTVNNFPFIETDISVNEIPVVKNGLISERQAAYWLAHNALINPNGEDYRVVAGASGPMFADTLLIFDATEVMNIDIRPANTLHFIRAFNEWGRYDDVIIMIKNHGNFRLDKAIESAVSLRKRKLFYRWEYSWALFERLLVVEFMKLGVPQNMIQYGLTNGRFMVQFPWAFPGRLPKKRIITFFDVNIKDPSFNMKYLQIFKKNEME